MNDFKTKYIKRCLRKIIKENFNFYLQNVPILIGLYLGIFTLKGYQIFNTNVKHLNSLNSTKKVRRKTITVFKIL